MHPVDILFYGHQTVIKSLDGLADEHWDIPGACGYWSIRQIIAHLASFELSLGEILEQLLGEDKPTPTLDSLSTLGPMGFNDHQVALRDKQTPRESWNEYEAAYHKSSKLFKRLPPELHRQDGLLAWYGSEYDFEDYLVYTYYGHKREHTAQINAFRDILKQ